MRVQESFDVVVVGAGWTGLSTAAALRAFGVSNFVLLESPARAFWRGMCYDRIKLHTAWHGLPCDGALALRGRSRPASCIDRPDSYVS